MDALSDFIFENAPIGLVATRHRLIEACSPRFAQMFGYTPEELEGKSLALLYPTTQEFIHIGNVGWGQMKQTQHYSDNRIMKRRDGSQFWCQVHGTSTTRRDPFAHCVWSFVDLSPQRAVVSLTRRERQIAMLIVEGLTNKQIGQRLGISHRTIEAHRSRMMGKLGAKTTAELFFMLAGLLA
jgi:PAS domain S-box-containing protein